MKQNKTSNKVTKPHKYRVSVYLGKDLFNKMNDMARFINLPISTLTRILLETGVNIGVALDAKTTQGLKK